jgi:hypothetical protein
MRHAVGLKAYSSQQPLDEFRLEANREFLLLLSTYRDAVVGRLMVPDFQFSLLLGQQQQSDMFAAADEAAQAQAAVAGGGGTSAAAAQPQPAVLPLNGSNGGSSSSAAAAAPGLHRPPHPQQPPLEPAPDALQPATTAGTQRSTGS